MAIGLALSFPLHFFRTRVTRVVDNWLTARSLKSLQVRIEKLQTELKDIERFPLMTRTEEFAFLGIDNVAKLIQYAIQTLVGLGVSLAGWFGRNVGHRVLYADAFALFMLIMNHTTYKMVMSGIRDYRRKHGPMERVGLQIRIDKLTSELTKKLNK